ncbi:hypothetical protein [Streptomyces sp. NPDC050528]|uniref:hypothetical protein n=1 Tax=Streptomyces sp. NPDC050528 TaxID=3365623 RepID=UPI00379F98BD
MRTTGTWDSDFEGWIHGFQKFFALADSAGIFGTRLRVFPTFQDNAGAHEDFNWPNGCDHGRRAHDQAVPICPRPSSTSRVLLRARRAADQFVSYMSGLYDLAKVQGQGFISYPEDHGAGMTADFTDLFSGLALGPEHLPVRHRRGGPSALPSPSAWKEPPP